MKIRMEIETTPEELRTFFGLPDVQSLQQEMMDKIRDNMRAGMEGFDPAALMKPFLPAHLQSMEAFQKSFWDTITKSMGAVTRKTEE